jgi:(1->4)-alpha-D-glucan 1-alpha-D-glucosylmutase
MMPGLSPELLGSTYRLQLHGIGFAAATALVPYLHELGIETLYVSPITAAAPGSTHGYDVVDPTRLDPALGTAEEFEALLQTLDRHHLRLLIDIVPNHLSTSADNRWWWDVLRRGRTSPYARFFDIDWSVHDGRILLPVLGRPLGEVLGAGELSVVSGHDGLVLAYGDHRFPVASGWPDPEGGDSDHCAPTSPDVLVRLLDHQHYRLAYWRTSRRAGNYRRFFDIDTLVGVRVEDVAVYETLHSFILELAADRRVAGFRIDHIDGLADPGAYLHRLRADVDHARGPGVAPAVLVVEKILDRHEDLRPDWPVQGTTGYEFADIAGGLFVKPGAGDVGFGERALSAKREVLNTIFSGQVADLARRACRAVEAETPGADLNGADAQAALVELISQLDVYRTYFDAGPALPVDRRRLDQATDRARPLLDVEERRLLDLLSAGLRSAGETHGTWLDVARRWQQLSGAVVAKGVEDTALYRTEQPAGVEVGGDPGNPAVPPRLFHEIMANRGQMHAGTLNATSTHDTKYGEDTRARWAVLTEWAAPWAEQLALWHKSNLGGDVPHRHDELAIYRAIVGIWPPLSGGTDEMARRVGDSVVKAAREAKLRTSWFDPDEKYEARMVRFVEHILDQTNQAFLASVSSVIDIIGAAGAVNALALLALKATAPGVPDFYQGSETWLRSLVDPDNRRPVGFSALQAEMAASGRTGGALGDKAEVTELLQSWSDGRIKLAMTRMVLTWRRSQRLLFRQGDYVALRCVGAATDHVVAFARRSGHTWSLTVAPRLAFTLCGPGRMPVGTDVWGDTAIELPPRAPFHFVDIFTGRRVGVHQGTLALGEIMDPLPVSVLVTPPS